mgnify:CR=1 FL=1
MELQQLSHLTLLLPSSSLHSIFCSMSTTMRSRPGEGGTQSWSKGRKLEESDWHLYTWRQSNSHRLQDSPCPARVAKMLNLLSFTHGQGEERVGTWLYTCITYNHIFPPMVSKYFSKQQLKQSLPHFLHAGRSEQASQPEPLGTISVQTEPRPYSQLCCDGWKSWDEIGPVIPPGLHKDLQCLQQGGP